MTDLIPEIKRRLKISEILARLGLHANRGGFVKSIYKPDDNTPSMKIYFDEDRYHCFATGKGGDVIQLWQDFYGIDIKQAVKELAEIAGIIISGERRVESEKRAPIKKKIIELIPKNLIDCLSLNEKALFGIEFNKIFGLSLDKEFEITPEFQKKFGADLQRALLPVKRSRLEVNKRIFREFHNYCGNMIGDEPFFKYLVQQRKLHLRKIVNHKIFFVIDYQKANNHLKKVFPLADLKRSGLFNENGNLVFFKHRIIIPYMHKGEIVYMRARFFDEKNCAKPGEGQSKYIGLSNDSLNVNTAKRFYNLDITEKMLKDERLMIVEGELDAVAGECLGVNTIAIPGANNIPEERRFAKLMAFDIVLCGDNDTAGNEMVKKLSELMTRFNKDFSIKEIQSKDVNDFLAA